MRKAAYNGLARDPYQSPYQILIFAMALLLAIGIGIG
jgi:hypothetical protein